MRRRSLTGGRRVNRKVAANQIAQQLFESVTKTRAKKSVQARIANAIEVVKDARDQVVVVHEFMSSVSPGVGPSQGQVNHTVNVVWQPTEEKSDDQSDCKKKLNIFRYGIVQLYEKYLLCMRTAMYRFSFCCLDPWEAGCKMLLEFMAL